jgi:protein-S-isoprenylcysteine O-methyltransferase Ste14
VTRLVLETVLHTAIVPGIVVVALPALLLWSGLAIPSFDFTVVRGLGGVLIATGIALGLWCTRYFVVSGRGTPNPLDPPKFLVRAGPYRLVRNPMYGSLVAILVGEALVSGSAALVIYCFTMLIVVHLVVVRYEEPTLRRTFGASYDAYCGQVPRWLPRPMKEDR